MYIITLLLLLYIILSHTYFYKKWMNLLRIYKELENNYKYLQIKYNSKQWVSEIMNPLISGMLAKYSTLK